MESIALKIIFKDTTELENYLAQSKSANPETFKDLQDKNTRQSETITNLQNNNASLKQDLDKANGEIAQLNNDIKQLKEENISEDIEELLNAAIIKERGMLLDYIERLFNINEKTAGRWAYYRNEIQSGKPYEEIKKFQQN